MAMGVAMQAGGVASINHPKWHSMTQNVNDFPSPPWDESLQPIIPLAIKVCYG